MRKDMHEEHEKKIKENLDEEHQKAIMASGLIREQVYELLKGMGFGQDEIEPDYGFPVEASGHNETCTIDFVITLGGKRVAAIKCAPDAIDSRQREAVAFCRVAGIPISIVTNFIESKILDAASGKLIGEGMEALPEKSTLAGLCASEICASGARLEKEKMILLAFRTLQCHRDSLK
ncbi:MAG: hypothetical protein M0Z52_01955 [Actinomycetota bacterium]|nr:hypothetical protein [Actinomycetota bacterium]